MAIEFLGSQTLEDFHNALVELSGDELWNLKPTGTNIDDSNSNSNVDNAGNNNSSSSNNDNAEKEQQESSGYFFIEGVFYTYGSVDYVGPILEWLKSGKRKVVEKRYKYLGLENYLHDGNELLVKPMSGTRLEDVAMRLGFRYVHVHHGDVECSVFAVDRKLGRRSSYNYPLVHDVWTISYYMPDCEGCERVPAVIATSTDCDVTDGHRALCEACARELDLQKKAPDKIEKYTIWREQGDLSLGASRETLF